MASRWFAGVVAAVLAAGIVPATADPDRELNTDAIAVAAPRPALPAGVPRAAKRTEPRLPAPDGWPFAEAFSRTSGTHRVWAGAYFWTDFIYDDNGAVTGPGTGESAGAYPFGTYRYPEPEQAGNGADIFRAAVGAGRGATWWRVDWNTLLRGNVPAAAFALDLDRSGGTPVLWGGNVGVRSAGVDATLVITSKGAFLNGTRVASTTVDRRARSFVARVPRTALNPKKSSRVYLAAGLANAAGDAFETLGPEHQHLPGQPNVFNLGFRDYADETADKNFWFEQAQATTLTAPAADVSAFGRTVNWDQLTAGTARQPQPLVRGWSNRWYVSSIELGQGRVKDLQGNVDNEPNYLGRVQPYGVYVPKGYRGSKPAPLTWLLHSLTINHNQYSATMPELLRLACESRTSICATTLGRGPDGYYRQEAELDFWEVWRTLGRTYSLDPDRTIIGGYSMGGFGAFNMGLDHPDLFAGMVILASAANEDLPRLENARWIPYYHAHGMQDELVPYYEEAVPTVEELDRLGYRYRFDSYPTKDHVEWSLEDGQEFAGRWIAGRDRVRRRNPGAIVYRWFPREVNRRWGIGPTGAWWVRGVRARDTTADDARVRAVSRARPEARVRVFRESRNLIDPNGAPVQRKQLGWKRSSAPEARPRMILRLANVGTVKLRLRDTGLLRYRRSVIAARTDGPVSVVLKGLPAGARVLVDGNRSDRSPRLSRGDHRIRIVR